MSEPRLPEALKELHENLHDTSSATLGEARKMLDRVIDLTVPNETVEMNDAAGLILLLRMVLGIELADRARIFDELVADLEVGG